MLSLISSTRVVLLALVVLLFAAQPASAASTKFVAYGHAQDYSLVGSFTLAKRGTFTVRTTMRETSSGADCWVQWHLYGNGHWSGAPTSFAPWEWVVEGLRFRRGEKTVYIRSNCQSWTFMVVRTGSW